MKKLISILAVLSLLAVLSPTAFATNGTNLIGIGPISRSMGGVGIAAPQDAISAVFANPAGMCFGPYCPSSQFDFAGTLFAPKVEGKVTRGTTTLEASGHDNVYAIPAIGISAPLSEGAKPWRFGLSAYGVSGLGVDYRNTAFDQQRAGFPTGTSEVQGAYTQLQIMKFAPAVAWQPLHNLSVGLAVHIDYSSLDLRNGSSFNYGLGAQLGLIYMPIDNLSLGFTYISPQNVDHKRALAVKDPATGALVRSADLELESPQQIGFGAAYTFFDKLLVEVDAKWLNWGSAKGYKDFLWDDQWVVALGAQYEVIPKLYLRAGYNFGENPVQTRNGWTPAGSTTVQGVTFPDPFFEEFRLIGFPAVVEHHLTAGIGYEFSEKFSLNLGFMHAFEETISETGTDFSGQPERIESTLSETSLDFGLTWRF